MNPSKLTWTRFGLNGPKYIAKELLLNDIIFSDMIIKSCYVNGAALVPLASLAETSITDGLTVQKGYNLGFLKGRLLKISII